MTSNIVKLGNLKITGLLFLYNQINVNSTDNTKFTMPTYQNFLCAFLFKPFFTNLKKINYHFNRFYDNYYY